MTIKLPEPDARVVGYCDIDGDCQYRMQPTQVWPDPETNMYTEATLKQAIKDALEEAARRIAERATKHSKLAMAVYRPGDELALEAFVLSEETVRKLKEQL